MIGPEGFTSDTIRETGKELVLFRVRQLGIRGAFTEKDIERTEKLGAMFGLSEDEVARTTVRGLNMDCLFNSRVRNFRLDLPPSETNIRF